MTFTFLPLFSLLSIGQVGSYILFFFSHRPLSCLSLPFTRQGGEVLLSEEISQGNGQTWKPKKEHKSGASM